MVRAMVGENAEVSMVGAKDEARRVSCGAAGKGGVTEENMWTGSVVAFDS